MQFDQVKRRELISLITVLVAARATRAFAQQQTKLPKIGFFGVTTPWASGQRLNSFIGRLRGVGWIEGRTILIEYRWAEGRTERFAEIATELVRLKVDVIVTAGAGPIMAAKAATSTTPIVFTVASDPVGTGLVASLARPGGNVTGLSYQGPDLAGKRLELLRELLHRFRRLAVLANSAAAGAMQEMHELRAAAGSVGIEVTGLEIQRSEDIASTLSSVIGTADALYVCADPLANTNRSTIISLALAGRLATIFGERENVDAGGLISYGPSISDLYRRAADHVDKILRGAKPAEIPVERPVKFELVINTKTAEALGLSTPPMLLARADEVIE